MYLIIQFLNLGRGLKTWSLSSLLKVKVGQTFSNYDIVSWLKGIQKILYSTKIPPNFQLFKEALSTFANHCTTKPTPVPSWRRFRKINVVLQILKPEKKVLFPKPTIDLPFYSKKKKKEKKKKKKAKGKILKPSRPINFAQKKVRDYCKEIYYSCVEESPY